MKKQKRIAMCLTALLLAVLCMFGIQAAAEEGLSGDNSLYSLGLENGECSPEFYYSTLEYDVTVPAGTEELLLDPITSDYNANIIALNGTKLENGKATTMITVEAPNGAQVTYTLNVTEEGQAAGEDKESETEKSSEAAAAEAAEIARQQAESEAAMRAQAEAKAAQDKIDKLNKENEALNARMDLILKICYGLIAFAVILLFFIINQSLRNKDLKDELKESRMQADQSYEFARKEQGMRSDYYYAPVQGAPQNQNAAGSVPVTDFVGMQNVYTTPVQEMPQETAAPAAPLNKREQKKQEKAAKKAAKKAPAAPAAPIDETMVRSNMEEPDVDVNMIDL